MKEYQSALKVTINILAAVLSGAVAFVFIAYGLAYKSLPFIEKYFILLISLSASICGLLVLAYIVFFILGKEAIYKLIFCTLIFLAIAGAIFFTICATGIIKKISSIEALRNYISEFGSMAVILYIVFCFLQVVILPVPGSVTVAAGVALFGPLWCSVYSFIGITLGSITAFAIGRWIGDRAVQWIVGKDTLKKWLEKLKGKDYLILSIMFLLPLFPDDVLCFVAGLSSMTWPYFLVMITITRATSVLGTAYSVGLIPFTTWWGILIWLVLGILIVLAFWLVCKYSDKIDYFIKNKLKIKK